MRHALRPLEPDCAWTSDQVAAEASWTEVLDDVELCEIHEALQVAMSHSGNVLDVTAEHFSLPTLSARIRRIERDLIDGRGFVRLRGVDRSQYSQPEMEMIYWGIGMHLGDPWPQNKHGHVLGDVMDQGKGLEDPTARGNEIGGAALPFHCDGSDLVGLMCLQAGAEGGLSAVANSVTVHNRLLEEDAEACAALYEPQPNDFRNEQKAGGRPWYMVPVFTEWNDRLFVRCIPPYIFASQRHEAAPRLTPEARRGLERLVELANDPDCHVKMELLPGDMQFINNFHVMHARTAYSDDPTAGKIRHLKRLWLETSLLQDKPHEFRRNISEHWERNRSVSRLPTYSP